MIEVNVWLYGKPAWDMPIEGQEDFDAEMFQEQADNLHDWLYKVADIVEKLKAADWNCYGMLYDIGFSKEGIKTKKEAVKELKRLGINTKWVNIHEFDDEFEEDEEVEEELEEEIET